MGVMDIMVAIFCIIITLTSMVSVSAEETCFTFKGNSFLQFSPLEPFDNSNSAHFQLQFKTTNSDGLLMYSEGAGGDIEALFIRGGRLHYYLFNTGRGGVGRQFGGHFVSQEAVDVGNWITVHVYRSYAVTGRTAHSVGSRWKTGIEFNLGGIGHSYTDGFQREQLELSRTIYFGGYRSRLSDTVGNFTGQMKEIWEHTNGFPFEYPSLNYKSQVELQCLQFAPPQ